MLIDNDAATVTDWLTVVEQTPSDPVTTYTVLVAGVATMVSVKAPVLQV